MKKLITIILTILMIVSLSGCSKKLPEQYDEETLLNAAIETIKIANERDYEALAKTVREDLYTDELADQIKDGWDKKLSEAGEYQEYQRYQTTYTVDDDDYEYAVIAIICKYENDTLTYTLSYDEDYRLVGLYMK